MKNKLIMISILLIYILVPIIILLNSYLYEIKFIILTITGLLIFIIMKIFKVSNKELGISKNNLLRSIKRNLLLIVISVLIIMILKLFHLDKYNPNETILFYTFYIFISCPIQEFLYRGVIGYFNKNSKYNYLWVIISSLCYSLVHIIYRDILTCLLTFIIGIIWYLSYSKDYNLAGVTISHIILGIITILLGIVN